MKTAWIVLGWSLLVCLAFSEGHIFMKDGIVGIGVDLSKLGIGGKCPPAVNVTCLCSLREIPVNVTISICSYTHRWKVKCRPCDNLEVEDICPKYSACLQCNADGKGVCATCPERKFGPWCENDCTCLNGGICERDGKCICTDLFEGRYCGKKKGCTPPGPIVPPLEVILTPPQRPITAVYSCPKDYELRGVTVSECLPNDLWSSDVPTCLPKCRLLSAPANGRLVFSDNELVEGVTATTTCKPYHRLIGEKKVYCLAGGQWSGELPVCEKLATCPDPGNTQNGVREIPPESVKLGANFIQDSLILYKCADGYEQVGADNIRCQFDGTWTDAAPSCIKVSTVIPDCNTKGFEVVSDEGVSVRIVCPPECADEDFVVWGTSIYRKDSSVCQAAIHSAKITNSGGQVAVINNGLYSGFTGSSSNNIDSQSFTGRDESFRFDKLPPLKRTDCEKGLVYLDHTCAYISSNPRTYNKARAVCSNMGLQLQMPEDSEDRLRLVIMLTSKNIDSIWSEIDRESSTEWHTDNDTITGNVNGSALLGCPSITSKDQEFKWMTRSCDEFLNFVCVKKSENYALAMCADPGSLEHGKAVPVGTIENVYYVGSSIEFSCNTRYYLKGEEVIACLGNGSWSDPVPTCIKVNACEDPPVPINGFVKYLPPLKTSTAQRSAVHRTELIGRRTARLPSGLSVAAPENMPVTTDEPETMPLPPGLHRIGSRAMYTCESRYYNLIGSGTRRCQGQGEWGGRPPTCIPVCGRSDSVRLPFIHNGNATDIGQWPWQAGIARFLPDYNQWFLLCGASLVNERWIITAAHCVTYAGTIITLEPDKFQVYVGKYHRQDSKDDEDVQVRKMAEIHIHPDYDPGLFDADIAVVQLESPVVLNSRVQPVCLPTEQTTRLHLTEGQRGVVTGWGMNENQSYSETLQQAVLPVVSQAECEKGYEESDLPLTVTDNMYCAGFAAGRSDACSGDSGGPMVFLDNSSKKYVLEGIVSWGSPQGCGNPKQYGGFTTVGRFLDWIHLFF